MKIKESMIGILICAMFVCACCGKTQLKEIAQQNTLSDSETDQNQEEEIQEVTVPEEDEVTEPDIDFRVEAILEQLTLEEKVAQMFVILPESLIDADCVTAAGETTRTAFDACPVGGFIYMEQNLKNQEQVQDMLSHVQEYSMERIGLPAFTCVDEEGGAVARIGGSGNFDVSSIENMAEIGASQNAAEAYKVGETIGAYLSYLGFNLDFAPVADVWSNSENKVVRYRSFGKEPDLVADMAIEVYKGLRENGILGTFKHFPGHGATEGDTHEGYAYTEKTLEKLRACEFIPFQKGIEAGVDVIMVGHISVPNIIGDNTPASLSHRMITEILREEMGYDGIVITDALNMGAIVQHFSSAEAAVQAILAGNDILLMPEEFDSAYQGVLEAVESQSIPMERIDESVRRIIKGKLELMKGPS